MDPLIHQGRHDPMGQESELLPTEPPTFFLRCVAWLLISIFVVALAAAIIIKVPETVRCSFVLAPEGGADPIQAPYQGIVSEVRVAEGQEVAEGAELFVLRSDQVRAKHTQFQTLTEDLRTRQDTILKLEAAHTAQITIKNEEIAQLERELEFRQTHAATSRDFVARLGKLARVGGVSKLELTREQLASAESEKDLHVTRRSLEALKLERIKLEAERARQRTEEAADVQKIQLQIAGLKRDLEGARDDLLSIRAPYHAFVISLTQRNAGNVVQAGAELCQLARVNATPYARLMIRESGLARLAPGQPLRLFFDAFPYQRYGTVTGKLEWISPSAVASSQGRQFTASASLKQTVIHVKGESRPLRVGMQGEARVTVGSRALIEYAFEPLRRLREDLQP
jgi:multidrug resistance efflux pump